MRNIIKKINKIRERRKRRSRAKIHGTAERPRLSIFISNKHIYLQLIDDDKGVTLASVSTVKEKGMKKSIDSAQKLGGKISEISKGLGIERFVLDRGGRKYHGIVKAVADGVRNSGIII